MRAFQSSFRDIARRKREGRDGERQEERKRKAEIVEKIITALN